MTAVPFQVFTLPNGTRINMLPNVASHSHNPPVDKGTDSGTGGSGAHKILQYGSRHTIQNIGWTTRLSCDPPPRKNTVAPPVPKLPIPPLGKTLKTVYHPLPVLSISKPTVIQLQPTPTELAKQGMALQLLNNANMGANQFSRGVAAVPGMVASIPTLNAAVAQVQKNANSPATRTNAPVVNTVLTMPAVDARSSGKAPTVCFVPISSVMCSQKSSSSSELLVSLPGTNGTAQAGSRVTTVMLPATPSSTCLVSKPTVTNSTTNPLSSDSLQASTKDVPMWNSNIGSPNLKMLTVKVHIDNGKIKEVMEVPQRSQSNVVPLFTRYLSTHSTSPESTVLSIGTIMDTLSLDHVDHIDTNSAQFGYYDLDDGTRIRIARDTCGQRHAPFLLLPKRDDDCSWEEATVELAMNNGTEVSLIPEEADVSEVGTVFSFEPLFVSEQTLVPLPRRKIRPLDANAKDKSLYAYRCYLCPFISDDHVEVCRHWVNKHLADLPYRCPLCERTFFTSTRAQVHMQRQHVGQGPTTVAFQQSHHFASTLSYELAEDDADNESSDSDGTSEEPPIILEYWSSEQQKRQNQCNISCPKCPFKAKYDTDMRRHIRLAHSRLRTRRRVILNERVRQPLRKPENGQSLQAEINWSDIWDESNVAGELWLQCRWCSFQHKNTKSIAQHIMQEHHWPEAVLCPACSDNIQLSEFDHRSATVSCMSCGATVVLAPSTSTELSGSPGLSEVPDDNLYSCNICAYKIQGRASMMRHIKYNHTKCRPYCCVYCNYVAVERSQVRLHIVTNHPGASVVVKERTESTEQFGVVVNELFSRLVTACSDDSDGAPPSNDADGNGVSGDGSSAASRGINSPLFTCKECHLETFSIQQLIDHQQMFHRKLLTTNAAMFPSLCNQQQTGGQLREHFKCKVCGYICLDRSCMSRHVKYMHITARPHSCTYCSYNNVERTKVRLHILSNHPGKQKLIRTDHRLLDEMSWQAKHFYMRIDRQGNEVKETSNSTVTNTNTVERPPSALSALSSDSDSELADDILSSLPQSYPPHPPSANEAKEEKNLSDDDADVDFHTNRKSTGAPLNSVYASDHNYIIGFSPIEFTDETEDFCSGFRIKEEPQDDAEDNDAFLPRDTRTKAKVKTETDSSDLSADDSDVYDSEISGSLANGDASNSAASSDMDAPAPKKIRVAFGTDVENGHSILDSILIDSKVWADEKLHMTPVVELEDVLQIILAWQRNLAYSGDS